MEASPRPYDFQKSLTRLDEILGAPAGAFEEVKSLPSRDKLTYANGFYSYCASVFVDIRGSSELPGKYQRPQLARIYRAFISEVVAALSSHSKVREVNIVGDCVWGVVDAPFKVDLDELLTVAVRARSIVDILNYKMAKKGYLTPVHVGVGLDYGRALMIKAGFNGSGINDVIYMGDVVNRASHLASKGTSGPFGNPIWVSSDFRGNLSDEHKALLAGFDPSQSAYFGNLVNVGMNDWLKGQR